MPLDQESMRTDLQSTNGRASGLVDLLDRVLDKGLMVAGDIKVSLAAERVSIAVADSGIGIAPKEPGSPLRGLPPGGRLPARRYTGAGLGRAIWRRLAGIVRGRLTVRGPLGEGATFTLTPPRLPRDDR